MLIEISSGEDRPESNAPNVEDRNRPWGFWLTLLFSAVIATVYAVVSVVVVAVLVGVDSAQGPKQSLEAELADFAWNGLYLSAATVIGSIISCGLIIVFAKLRRGIELSDYLGFKPVAASILTKWLVFILVFLVSWDLSNWLLGRPVVPSFMVQAYATAGIVPLFWLAIVVAAPVGEELFFRGFLFAGLSASRLGIRGTIAITALTWGLIHTQYELFDILMICLLGAVLGWARLKTGSIYTPVILHAVTNLGATLEVWWLNATGK